MKPMTDPTPEQVREALKWGDSQVSLIRINREKFSILLTLARERAAQIEEGPVGSAYRHNASGRVSAVSGHSPPVSLMFRLAPIADHTLIPLFAGPPQTAPTEGETQ